jgi:hypothetical protein
MREPILRPTSIASELGPDFSKFAKRVRKAVRLDTFWYGFAAGCVVFAGLSTISIFVAKAFL